MSSQNTRNEDTFSEVDESFDSNHSIHSGVLDSITIRNFRVFDVLHISKLRRINLFAGGNHSGKTSLLEAFFSWQDVGIRMRHWMRMFFAQLNIKSPSSKKLLSKHIGNRCLPIWIQIEK